MNGTDLDAGKAPNWQEIEHNIPDVIERCLECNLSMKDTNMNEFMALYKMKNARNKVYQ